MEITIFLYKWKIKSGKEKQFEDNWSVMTQAIREECGSYGSRLHISESGEYMAYAQWPDAETRERCELDSSVSSASQLMRDAIEHSYPYEQFKTKIDLLSFNNIAE